MALLCHHKQENIRDEIEKKIAANLRGISDTQRLPTKRKKVKEIFIVTQKQTHTLTLRHIYTDTKHTKNQKKHHDHAL